MDKKQSRLAWAESAANVVTGMVTSIVLFQPLIFWIEGVELQTDANIRIAIYFTIISIVRGYIWRRWFHKKFYVEGESDEEFNIIDYYINNNK